ncbi:putative survival motor neuron protein [Apostichopus japonicus]|uniref:Putative survival motor neuron protein n=1 Tax=Stichopus japonicus TaxID=307972 RepID=A0A2G8KVC2_STIJA|nr:putative survival motor neuron protein [Apostichopus japonicus]
MAAHGAAVFLQGQTNGNESDIWDDTALIKAYDKAINSVKSEINGEQPEEELEGNVSEPTQRKAAKKGKNKRKKRKSSQRRRWKVGDRCSAVFSDDHLVYEAIIKSVNYKLGTCWVTYTGYGNEEEKNLDELMGTQEVISQEEDNYFSENGNESLEMDTFSNTSQSPHYIGTSGYPPPPQQRRLHPPAGPPWQFPHPQQWNNTSFPPQASPFDHGPFGPPPPPRERTMGNTPPPPPPPTDNDQDALYAMLMAWYMSGYHTGYFQGLKGAQRKRGVKTDR